MRCLNIIRQDTIIILLLLALYGCSKNRYQTDSGMVWNTLYNITYQSDENFNDSILTVFDHVAKSVSVFDPQSVVRRVNQSDTGVKVDKYFIDVYRMSKKINRLSANAFDPTLEPLITAWGFGKGHKATADTARIDSLLRFVGIEKTWLEDNYIYKQNPLTRFNFSALAKGYGVDQVAYMFTSNGVKNYLVDVGGEIYASGVNKNHSKWRVSIDSPDSSDILHKSVMVIQISNCGVATSGNYRNYHSSNKGSYGHTINRHTGRPAATDILSATIVATSCMEADALATASMALGSKRAEEMLKQTDCAYMFILSDHSIIISDKFKSLIIN